ncbi:hypothetical protein BDQ94DRAFT_164516 [Aspergillus welwitschiae]|uniref:Uncharacterized protein n=1 Tax=Aspergillus welwitschiae TaxID=1341132 RepID=A0A3F3PHP1_9EURO|nr:hypothetical protein BDQ94DRAFT_164516 [Aspergillus welwitschiae]RDH26408.1 hypothetical protein BDQ94DRAFT_164516 [Aspergillus welwitschiae]
MSACSILLSGFGQGKALQIWFANASRHCWRSRVRFSLLSRAIGLFPNTDANCVHSRSSIRNISYPFRSFNPAWPRSPHPMCK